MRTSVDLRLVPAAACAWLVAGALAGRGAPTSAAVALALAGAAVALTVRRARKPEAGGSRAAVDRVRFTVLVALVAGAATAATAAAGAHAAGAGVLPALVAQRADVRVEGRVASPPTLHGGHGEDRLLVRVAVRHVTAPGAAGPATGELLVAVPAGTALPFGAAVGVDGSLGAPWTGDGAIGTLTARGPVRVRPPASAVDRTTDHLRSRLLAVTAGLPPDSRGLVPGAAVGDTSRVPPDLEAAMRVAGLTHMTAVSGGHFAVLAAAVAAACSALRLPRAARAAVAAASGGAFVLLVHPGPAVLRAAVMAAIGVAALLMRRPAPAVPALAATVVLLLVVDPWTARSYGFALSVTATAAIVVLAPAMARRAPPAARGAALVLAVPASAQLVCAPVLVMLQPTVTPYAVVANLLAAPALVPATLLGLAATLVAPLHTGLAEVLAWSAHPATWWIASVARVVASLPGAVLPWPAGPGGAAALAALTAAVLVVWWRWHDLARCVRHAATPGERRGGAGRRGAAPAPRRARPRRRAVAG